MAEAPFDDVVASHRQAIHALKEIRVQLLARRRRATDGAMVHIDEVLALNARALKSLERGLELAESEAARRRR